jgi:hypothetical protein
VVEVSVAGEPRPIARRFSLWNQWVDHDARRLSLGVYDIRAIPADHLLDAGRLPRTLAPSEVRETLLYDGLHTDDWLGRRFTLTVPTTVTGVKLGVTVPQFAADAAPGNARILVPGAPPRVESFLGYGDADIDVEIPAGSGRTTTIAFEFSHFANVATRDAAGLDERKISTRLRWIELRGTHLAKVSIR